jgi:lipopolysaccharide biosynthesis glycosyltransferase
MRDICFAFTDESGTYHKHVLVALESVLRNASAPVRAHLLHDETLTPSMRGAFEALSARHRSDFRFYDAPDAGERALANARFFGKGALFRLFAPQLIEADRLLYLDCDIVCGLDIDGIFTATPEEAVLAGVLDSGLSDSPSRLRQARALGIDPGGYFNSGVLLVNLNRLRRDYPDFTEAVLGIIAEKRPAFPDQDAMNAYCAGRNAATHFLPERFNYLVGAGDRAFLPSGDLAGKILHYTRDKPWNALYPAALAYWKYYAACFSPEEAFAGMQALGAHEYAHLYAYLLRAPKVRRMIGRVRDVDERGLSAALLDRLMPRRRARG